MMGKPGARMSRNAFVIQCHFSQTMRVSSAWKDYFAIITTPLYVQPIAADISRISFQKYVCIQAAHVVQTYPFKLPYKMLECLNKIENCTTGWKSLTKKNSEVFHILLRT